MSQLGLRKKPGIENVRKEEWARPKGSHWARKRTGSNRNRRARAKGRVGRERAGGGVTLTWHGVRGSLVFVASRPSSAGGTHTGAGLGFPAQTVGPVRGRDCRDHGMALDPSCLGHWQGLGYWSAVRSRATPVWPVPASHIDSSGAR